MSENEKTDITYRCPVCYSREIDVVLHKQKDSKNFYCVKCSFIGSQSLIHEMYNDLKKKYKKRTTRYTLEELINM